MLSTPLHDACKKDKVSLDEILELLNDGPDDVMKKGQYGGLPIYWACANGQSFEVIDALIKAYPDGLKELDDYGLLLIHYACEQGQSIEVIEALIKAYPDGLKVQDQQGGLPIHYAFVKGQSFEVIDALIKEYPDGLKVPTSKGQLPIHLACANWQSFEVIDALIKEFPDGAKERDGDGGLPIHEACVNGQSIEVIAALIMEYPVGLKERDNDGRLPIHRACANGQSFEVIEALIKVYPDGLEERDNKGRLPIHWACEQGHDEEGFRVIEALIKEYPEALGQSDTDGKTPFEWDYEESCGGHFNKFIQNLSSRLDKYWEDDLKKYDERKKEARRLQATRWAFMLNMFSGYAIDDNDLYNLLPQYSLHLPPYEGILTHCKNYMPVEILRIVFTDEKTLESHSFTEWLSGMNCKRSVVCMMVLEFYLHMAWIYTFVSASRIYFVESDDPLGWRPTALLVFAAIFLLEEIDQFTRLHFTGALQYYCLDLWNWIDVVTCVMVIVSAARFLDEDSSIDGRLLMTTGCFQALFLLSYLKKTLFPFSKFVSGVIKIIWAVLPFLVVSAVTLLTFSFMYFVQDQDELKNRDVVLVFDNTNNSNLEDDASFASLMLSFQTVFDKFAGGAKESLSVLDFFFGIIVVIVLLNVIIAVVSNEWDEAEAEAIEEFLKYRFDSIIEKTRGSSLYLRLCHLYNGTAGLARLFGLPVPKIPRELIREWELEWNFNENNYCDWGSHLDEIFIDPETVGTTMEEFKMKLAVKNKEDGMFAWFRLLMECFVFFVLGFPTFGLLWPQFIRQMLFTPSKPKESSDVVSERKREISERKREISEEISERKREISEWKRETFEREIAKKVDDQNELLTKKVVDQNELLAEYKKDQNESLAEYKKTVSELSQKVSAQNDLLEQLLKKVS